MKKSFANKPVLIMIIAVVLLLVLAFFSASSRTIPWVESAVGWLMRPVQTVAYKVSDGVSGFFRNLFNSTDADLENAKLKQQLAQYEQTKLDYSELVKENERLRAMLNYAGSLGDIDFVTAKVIGRSNGVWFDMITLNVGRSRGIEPGMPVICGDGLVGKVTDVGANWCKVTSVIDSSVTVAVTVERTRDNCMVRGVFSTTNASGELELYYLPTDLTDLVPGDVIMTSGIGGIYPKGVKVGTVEEVMLDTESPINAVVTPSVDFLHIEEVMVVTGFGGEN
ncbi:MAG: rod shape-determining protein MreC [Clostridiales bacterium]|nr:rod shape-determining protein MreC [Clostridiales bacterium]